MTAQFKNTLPYQQERWLSFSIHVPSDFNLMGGTGSFGLVVWGSKPNGATTSGWLGLILRNNTWQIVHRYEADLNASGDWWKNTTYDKATPSSTEWAQGLVDFPDEVASKASLGNLNKGGWTDFIINFKNDVSDYSVNTGFLDIYMRASSDPWVHVIGMKPMRNLAYSPSWTSTNPERVYDRGIGRLASNGSGSNIGLYSTQGEVWTRSSNLTLHFDNYKVGDENTTFSMMTHDGSSPGVAGVDRIRPRPPTLRQSQ